MGLSVRFKAEDCVQDAYAKALVHRRRADVAWRELPLLVPETT
jgi:DNA-directed RNA polymerase specialized sigma24 family protein